MPIQDSDLLLVNNAGSSYHIRADELASLVVTESLVGPITSVDTISIDYTNPAFFSASGTVGTPQNAFDGDQTTRCDDSNRGTDSFLKWTPSFALNVPAGQTLEVYTQENRLVQINGGSLDVPDIAYSPSYGGNGFKKVYEGPLSVNEIQIRITSSSNRASMSGIKVNGEWVVANVPFTVLSVADAGDLEEGMLITEVGNGDDGQGKIFSIERNASGDDKIDLTKEEPNWDVGSYIESASTGNTQADNFMLVNRAGVSYKQLVPKFNSAAPAGPIPIVYTQTLCGNSLSGTWVDTTPFTVLDVADATGLDVGMNIVKDGGGANGTITAIEENKTQIITLDTNNLVYTGVPTDERFPLLFESDNTLDFLTSDWTTDPAFVEGFEIPVKAGDTLILTTEREGNTNATFYVEGYGWDKRYETMCGRGDSIWEMGKFEITQDEIITKIGINSVSNKSKGRLQALYLNGEKIIYRDPWDRLHLSQEEANWDVGSNIAVPGLFEDDDLYLVNRGSKSYSCLGIELNEYLKPPPIVDMGWNAETDIYRRDAVEDRNIDVQIAIRRCLMTDAGVVTAYLDADDSTKLAGDWLRLIETTELDTPYTGTHGAEVSNVILRDKVPAWIPGTYSRGHRATHNGHLWECIAEITSEIPASGTVNAVLNGSAGQVMVQIPCFSVRHDDLPSGAYHDHIFYTTRGVKTDDGFEVHPAFIRPDGSIRNFIYVGAYGRSANATSISGANQDTNKNRPTTRSICSGRGTGWHQTGFWDYNALQWLYITEYQDMNSQRAVGNGLISGDNSGATSPTGQSNPHGNGTANKFTSSNTDYMSYRGVENLWGKTWEWLDGINLQDGKVYTTSDSSVWADDTTNNYDYLGTVTIVTGQYIRDLIPGVTLLPASAVGASGTTFVGDAVWTRTGWRAFLAGGDSPIGDKGGIFAFNGQETAGRLAVGVGSRLCYHD